MKHKRTTAAIWRTVIVLTVAFIWAQSLLGRELSRLQSETVQGFLGSVLGEWVYDTMLYRYIRKVAHFTEYALLGAEVMGYRLSVGRVRCRWWPWLAVGPAVAVCDELLQFISARAPRVTDVLLDCSGYICGAAVVWAAVTLWRRFYPQKSSE